MASMALAACARWDKSMASSGKTGNTQSIYIRTKRSPRAQRTGYNRRTHTHTQTQQYLLSLAQTALPCIFGMEKPLTSLSPLAKASTNPKEQPRWCRTRGYPLTRKITIKKAIASTWTGSNQGHPSLLLHTLDLQNVAEVHFPHGG